MVVARGQRGADSLDRGLGTVLAWRLSLKKMAIKRRMGWTVGIAMVAVLVSAAIVYGSTVRKRSSLEFESAPVDRGRIVARVTATGTLSALVTVQVGSQVSGRINAIFVDFSSPVTKGQVIARIDRQMFQAAAEQARANRAAAEGNLAKADAQAAEAGRQTRRAKTLADRQLIARAEAETRQADDESAKAGVAAARGGVAQARAAQHQAEVSLAYATIVSPINGIVISRNVDIGQTVAASLQSPTLFTIAEDLCKMQVDTAVSEADVGKLRGSASATFTVDAYPNETFRGTIRQIRDAPQAVQNVVTYDAVVDVDNSDLKLKPGMTANVTFVYAERTDVLRLPSAALRFRPPPGLLGPPQNDEGLKKKKQAKLDKREATEEAARAEIGDESRTAARRPVWLLRGERATPIPVEVGISDGNHVELLTGDLHEGDELVTDATSTGKDSLLQTVPTKKSKKLF
jgi:HlyD family secretion protein